MDRTPAWSEMILVLVWEIMSLSNQLTVFAARVEALDVVVEADSYGSEGHLSLKPGDQAVVERARPLGSHHGADGPKHPSVPDAFSCARHRRLSLDLEHNTEIVMDLTAAV